MSCGAIFGLSNKCLTEVQRRAAIGFAGRQIAARFGLVVTQKVAAQAIPVVGALGGGAVNYAFIDHFQDVELGHFTVRRLERLYGKERIRSEYDLIVGKL